MTINVKKLEIAKNIKNTIIRDVKILQDNPFIQEIIQLAIFKP